MRNPKTNTKLKKSFALEPEIVEKIDAKYKELGYKSSAFFLNDVLRGTLDLPAPLCEKLKRLCMSERIELNIKLKILYERLATSDEDEHKELRAEARQVEDDIDDISRFIDFLDLHLKANYI